MNLDVLDVCASLFLASLSALMINPVTFQVISTVPSSWPVNMMSTFLSRSFRRTLHAQQEGKIIKNISAGQNLEVGPPGTQFYFIRPFWYVFVFPRSKTGLGIFSETKVPSLRKPPTMTTMKRKMVGRNRLTRRLWKRKLLCILRLQILYVASMEMWSRRHKIGWTQISASRILDDSRPPVVALISQRVDYWNWLSFARCFLVRTVLIPRWIIQQEFGAVNEIEAEAWKVQHVWQCDIHSFTAWLVVLQCTFLMKDVYIQWFVLPLSTIWNYTFFTMCVPIDCSTLIHGFSPHLLIT